MFKRQLPAPDIEYQVAVACAANMLAVIYQAMFGDHLVSHIDVLLADMSMCFRS